MNIAILGAGNVGGHLASLWVACGHHVTFGVRRDSPTARRFPAGVQAADASVAVAAADVVALCVPWPAVETVLCSAGPLDGKVLIDATNPLLPDLSGLVCGTTTSGAEQVARWATGAKVVKACNTIGAGLLGNADFGDGVTADGFICGDDGDAKRTVAGLVADAGLNPVDVGPLVMARCLEPLALLWIDLAVRQALPPDFAFKLLRRAARAGT